MGGGSTETRRALDCGAGIGRITKRLLLPIFKEVDSLKLSLFLLILHPSI
jgi:protein N-terminal methyltransferase